MNRNGIRKYTKSEQRSQETITQRNFVKHFEPISSTECVPKHVKTNVFFQRRGDRPPPRPRAVPPDQLDHLRGGLHRDAAEDEGRRAKRLGRLRKVLLREADGVLPAADLHAAGAGERWAEKTLYGKLFMMGKWKNFFFFYC